MAAAASLCAAPTTGAGSSEFFTALRTGRFAAFDSTPAHLVRQYAKTALATYKHECPRAAPDYEIPWDLAAYVAMPFKSAHGSGVALFAMGVAASDAAFLARADGEADVRSLIQKSDCAERTHADWVTHVKKALADPRVVGPLPQALKACEAHRASHNDDCACFAIGYDMQASPEKRREFLDAETPLKGLQRTLADANFAQRVAYKCPTTPNFFRPELAVQVPSHAGQADDQHRLMEGKYDIRAMNVGYDPGNHGTYTITRTDNWRYAFRWQKGATVRDLIGYLSADGRQMTVYSGEPKPRTYRVLSAGRLQGLDPYNQVELAHVSTRDTRLPPDPRIPPQRDRTNQATAQQCSRLESDIERFRGDPRRTSTLAILEKRYADWCKAR